MPRFFLTLTFLGASCTTNERKPNKYNSDIINSIYSKEGVNSLAVTLHEVNSIFEKINLKSIVPIAQLGFTFYQGKLFFNHCYGGDGAYKNLDDCDLDLLIASSELNKLKLLAASLYSKGIVAGNYRARLKRMIFILDYASNGPEDVRFICVRRQGDEALVTGTDIRILDRNDKILLLTKSRY